VTKSEWRRRIRAVRASRDQQARDAAGLALAGHAAAVTRPVVAAFVGVGTEPPTLPLLLALRALRAQVLLPVLQADDDLDWAVFDASLVPKRKGLLEPSGPLLGVEAIGAADAVLVPALAVDTQGRRLGQGGGSYDRALPRARGRVIAVVFDDELVSALPTDPHDRLVSAVLTPHGGLRDVGNRDEGRGVC
jgi:5-formyltetrahydrofolate cyclo-ligase